MPCAVLCCEFHFYDYRPAHLKILKQLELVDRNRRAAVHPIDFVGRVPFYYLARKTQRRRRRSNNTRKRWSTIALQRRAVLGWVLASLARSYGALFFPPADERRPVSNNSMGSLHISNRVSSLFSFKSYSSSTTTATATIRCFSKDFFLTLIHSFFY